MVFEIASSKIAFLISADMKDNFNYYLTKEEIKKNTVEYCSNIRN